MSTGLIYKTSTSNGEETKSLAQEIGRRLKGGEVFILNGDLGFGKTVFVKGLALGAGFKEDVTSPSFTISNVYEAPNFTIHHMDYYRISEPGVLKAELSEIIKDERNIVAIEWADVIKDYLPQNSIYIDIFNEGESRRSFMFKYPESFGYLFEELA